MSQQLHLPHFYHPSYIIHVNECNCTHQYNWVYIISFRKYSQQNIDSSSYSSNMNCLFSMVILVKYIFTVFISEKFVNKLLLLSRYKYADEKNTMMGNILKGRKICWGKYSEGKSCGKQNEKEYIGKIIFWRGKTG